MYLIDHLLRHHQNTIWVYGLEHHVWQKIDRDTKPELVDSDWTGPRPRFAHQFVYDSDQDEYYVSQTLYLIPLHS